MEIRESVESDKPSIYKVHLNAFDASEREIVSRLALDILEDKTALPILSLVAEQDGEIVGNIIFSSVKIAGAEDVTAFILAPLAVASSVQKRGVGTGLITKGLEILKERGAKLVFVYGDPNYYMQTGFKVGQHLKPSYVLEYPEGWMAQELVEGVYAQTQGVVLCAASLDSPDLW